MQAMMMGLRRTWMATLLFLAIPTSIWWVWLSWESARQAIAPTLFLTPAIWWWLVGRKRTPGLTRGSLAGAFIAVMTQAVPYLIPIVWQRLARGPGVGEDQLIAMVGVGFYLFVGLGAAVIGSFIGWMTVAIQRRLDRAMAQPIESDSESSQGTALRRAAQARPPRSWPACSRALPSRPGTASSILPISRLPALIPTLSA